MAVSVKAERESMAKKKDILIDMKMSLADRLYFNRMAKMENNPEYEAKRKAKILKDIEDFKNSQRNNIL